MKLWGAVLLALALAPASTAETRISLQGGKIRVNATLATLAEVLDRLGQTTGMTVVYEGARPAERLTIALEASTAAEAVLGVLEGQRVNYALRFDKTGTKVETLMLSTATSSATGPRAAASSPPAPPAMTASSSAEDAPEPEPAEEVAPEPPPDLPAGFVHSAPKAHEGPPPTDPSTLTGGAAPPGAAPGASTSPPPAGPPNMSPQVVWPAGSNPFPSPIPMPVPSPRPNP